MACTPFVPPQAGLFINNTQQLWSNSNQTPGAGRSVTYSGGTFTVAGPNGSTVIPSVANRVVHHKFFGPSNFLAVLVSEKGPGPVEHTMLIVDFTAPSIQTNQVLHVLSASTLSLPWLQYAQGSGSLCLIGAPTSSGVAGISILRSDTGAVLCPGPSAFNPTQQVIGEATATAVQIKHGGAIIGGPCPFPSGKLDVQPNTQSFGTVVVGGCPQTPPTRQFTLKNTGDDCLQITGIGALAPYSVTSQSTAFPANLGPNQAMTVTVTFAPTAAGSFNNVSLPVTRSPAAGESALVCSGQAKQAQPALSTPGTINLGHVLVGTPVTGNVTLKNTGEISLSVQVAAFTNSLFTWPALGQTTLSCGQQVTLPITFTPPTEGPQLATLTIQSPSTGDRLVRLVGDGCRPNARIEVPPPPFPGYGQVRQGFRIRRSITVRNTGDATLTFTATITGPDARLFGLMKPSQSFIDVLATRTYNVDPIEPCGGGPTGPGAEEVAVVFFANAAPPHTATARLTIDHHNDPTAASFTYDLAADVIARVYAYGLEFDGLTIKDLEPVGPFSSGSGPGKVTVGRPLADNRAFVDWAKSDVRRNVGLIRWDTRGSEADRWHMAGARAESYASDVNEEFLTLLYEDVVKVHL
jgi:hypothetical protein